MIELICKGSKISESNSCIIIVFMPFRNVAFVIFAMAKKAYIDDVFFKSLSIIILILTQKLKGANRGQSFLLPPWVPIAPPLMW